VLYQLKTNSGSILCRRSGELWTDTLSLLSVNGAGADVVAIREFIALVRQKAQPQPIAVTIVNAKDIGSVAKVLTVKDDTGKLSGAVSQPIS
jgi:hypothetical protein